MRTESTQSLLWKVARKLGLDPATNLTDLQAHPLLSYLNEGAKMVWESWDWHDVCNIEQRWYAYQYVTGINITNPGVDPTINIQNPPPTYVPYDPTFSPQGNIIVDPATGLYWMALAPGDPGSPSISGTGAWFPVVSTGQVAIINNPYLLDAPLLSPFVPPPPIINPNSTLVFIPALIPYQQTGFSDIGTVFGVYSTDPRLTNAPIPVSYTTTKRGIELGPTQLNFVWIHYRPPFPGIGIESWSASATYNINDVVYSGSDTYYALAFNTNTPPVGDTTGTWQQFQLPHYMSAGVVTYSYACALEEDGQDDKAQIQYQKADSLWVKEYDKQESQQGITSFWNARVR